MNSGSSASTTSTGWRARVRAVAGQPGGLAGRVPRGAVLRRVHGRAAGGVSPRVRRERLAAPRRPDRFHGDLRAPGGADLAGSDAVRRARLLPARRVAVADPAARDLGALDSGSSGPSSRSWRGRSPLRAGGDRDVVVRGLERAERGPVLVGHATRSTSRSTGRPRQRSIETGVDGPARRTGHRLQAGGRAGLRPPWMERFLRFVAADPALKLRLRLAPPQGHRRRRSARPAPPVRRRRRRRPGRPSRSTRSGSPGSRSSTTRRTRRSGSRCRTRRGSTSATPPGWARSPRSTPRWTSATARPGCGSSPPPTTPTCNSCEAPFDGRRSIMTRATPDRSRPTCSKCRPTASTSCSACSGTGSAPSTAGEELLFPRTDLYHLPTVGDAGVACLLDLLPRPRPSPVRPPRTIDYAVDRIPVAAGQRRPLPDRPRHARTPTRRPAARPPIPIPCPTRAASRRSGSPRR